MSSRRNLCKDSARIAGSNVHIVLVNRTQETQRKFSYREGRCVNSGAHSPFWHLAWHVELEFTEGLNEDRNSCSHVRSLYGFSSGEKIRWRENPVERKSGVEALGGAGAYSKFRQLRVQIYPRRNNKPSVA